MSMDKLLSTKTPESIQNCSHELSDHRNSNSSHRFSYLTSFPCCRTIPTHAAPLLDTPVIKEPNEHSTKASRRSYSAPSIFTCIKESQALALDAEPTDSPTTRSPWIVRQAIVGAILYISVGIIVFMVRQGSFKGHRTFPLVDGLYFAIVSMCTIGYGDIVPHTSFTKLFTCAFILVGFGFVDVLLNGLLTYVLDKQEAVLLSAVDESRRNVIFRTYVMDMRKGRMRVRMKVGLALCVVICCVAVGTVMVHVLEGLAWLDSFYLSVTSVTTVGYGDYTFLTMKGRLFASVWLLVSTLAVAKAFLYLTELRIEKRNRRTAEWVLKRKMTAGDLMAADLDNNGSISKSEFVIYKLKEMGKISEKDIMLICNQFDELNAGKCGKITLSDLVQESPLTNPWKNS
ncbi:two pore potassium channel c-like [Musa acuminata AAA Group]|uniref:two pore potassium channel c-like n=1 Tax=Musa acuminata AAA Group TaxID=214697 RepID=UPI0031D104A7